MSLNLSNNEHAYPFIIGNTKLPYFLAPYYNPNRFELSSQKEYNRTQTIGGQVFEHWGKRPPVLHVEMTVLKNDFSGNYVGMYENAIFQDPLINTELDALQRLYELDQRYIKNLSTSITSSNEIDREAEEVSASKKSKSVFSKVGGVFNSVASTFTPTNLVELGSKTQDLFLSKFSDSIIYYKMNIYSGFFMNFKVIEDGKLPFTNQVSFDFLVTSTIADSVNEWISSTKTGRALSGVLGTVSAVSSVTSVADSVTNGAISFIKNQVSGITNGK